MLIQTWTFFFFFAAVFAGFQLIRKTRLKIPWLWVASYVFYGWWNPRYVLLLAYVTAVDWAVVTVMHSWRKSKWLVALSAFNSFGLLAYFKYTGFALNSVNHTAAFFGLSINIPIPHILLPVGISFFIFQSMSYVVDFYRGQLEREPSFLRYATYVSFFPQLLAGPIERARNFLPQLRQSHSFRWEDVTDGASLFIVGLFKKIALADYMALYVGKVYGAPGEHDSGALLLATVVFAWQIYFDFSGYTDMVRGVAKILGFHLRLNFNNPYLATGLGDFWNRWHISLSSWFKDYVYIPLGGNRKGPIRTYINMIATMVISGVWHGAAWTFVIWGALHAIGRIITRELERSALYRDRVPVTVKRLMVFAFVCFAWIFFRTQSFGEACLVIGRIAQGKFSNPQCPWLLLGWIAAIWAYQWMYESRLKSLLEKAWVKIALATAMVLYMILFTATADRPFIYFQF